MLKPKQPTRSHFNEGYPQNCIFEKDNHLQNDIFTKDNHQLDWKTTNPTTSTKTPYFFIWNSPNPILLLSSSRRICGLMPPVCRLGDGFQINMVWFSHTCHSFKINYCNHMLRFGFANCANVSAKLNLKYLQTMWNNLSEIQVDKIHCAIPTSLCEVTLCKQ